MDKDNKTGLYEALFTKLDASTKKELKKELDSNLKELDIDAKRGRVDKNKIINYFTQLRAKGVIEGFAYYKCSKSWFKGKRFITYFLRVKMNRFVESCFDIFVIKKCYFVE